MFSLVGGVGYQRRRRSAITAAIARATAPVVRMVRRGFRRMVLPARVVAASTVSMALAARSEVASTVSETVSPAFSAAPRSSS